jgi:hypothetical protein
MMATFDLVCAELTCPCCGRQVEDPCAIDLQTHAFEAPALRAFRVGDRVELVPGLRDAGYLQTADEPDEATLRVLETWVCPECGTSNLWAELSIADGVLADVRPAGLTPADIARAGYVSREVLLYVPQSEVLAVEALAPAALRARIAAIGWQLPCAEAAMP